jgi:three-Cys-motif partner protein
MNRFWGDNSWKLAAYAKSRQANLFSEPDDEKQSNRAIVEAFRERLQKVAGFEFVPEPISMINRRNAVVYYLFFASPKPVAKDIITHIFRKHRR